MRLLAFDVKAIKKHTTLYNKSLWEISGGLLILVGLALLVPCVRSQQECECPPSMCPDGWMTFRGSCYYISDNISANWTVASVSCFWPFFGITVLVRQNSPLVLNRGLMCSFMKDATVTVIRMILPTHWPTLNLNLLMHPILIQQDKCLDSIFSVKIQTLEMAG